MTLDQFEILARSRRSVRHFRPDEVPQALLTRLLDVAQWAPSGYNLQPTHRVVVRDAAIKQRLFSACMEQRQIIEAPILVVFTGDRRVVQNNFERMLAAERAAGTINAEYEQKIREYVPLAFDCGPLGLGWLWKATLAPLISTFRPIPSLPAVHRRYWLAKQVMLPAMVFMLAAQAAELATVPMEGFDEGRVRRILGIPRWHVIPVMVALGYSADGELRKTRLASAGATHWDGWT